MGLHPFLTSNSLRPFIPGSTHILAGRIRNSRNPHDSHGRRGCSGRCDHSLSARLHHTRSGLCDPDVEEAPLCPMCLHPLRTEAAQRKGEAIQPMPSASFHLFLLTAYAPTVSVPFLTSASYVHHTFSSLRSPPSRLLFPTVAHLHSCRGDCQLQLE